MISRTPANILIYLTKALTVLALSLTSAQAGTRRWDGGTVDIGSVGNSASIGGVGTSNTAHVAWNYASKDTAVVNFRWDYMTFAAVPNTPTVGISSVTATIAGTVPARFFVRLTVSKQ